MSLPAINAGPPDALLTINRRKVVENWQAVAAEASTATCAAVVKADCYGLGMAEIVPKLHEAGCRQFFVAQLEEGYALRQLLPNPEVEIFILNGVRLGSEVVFIEHDLIPVVNTKEQLTFWRRACATSNRALKTAIHVDTGMTRLGLLPEDFMAVRDSGDLDALSLRLVMSHLACADEPDHPLNAQQLALFQEVTAGIEVPRSLAASSAIFLGAEYHFDLVRPGVALYGGNPVPGQPNPMQGVIELQAKILDVHTLTESRSVGYGATFEAPAGSKLITIGLGYADGYLRSLSNQGYVNVFGTRCPVVGRVSMDLVIIDVSQVTEPMVKFGSFVEVIGENISINEVADWAGTIPYEILTGLGPRYVRRYMGR